jgi:hypothetical protein
VVRVDVGGLYLHRQRREVRVGNVEPRPGVELQGWIPVDGVRVLVGVRLTSARPYLEGRLIVDHRFARGTLLPLSFDDGGRALLMMLGDQSNSFIGIGKLTRKPTTGAAGCS